MLSGGGGVEGADPDQVAHGGFHLEPGPVPLLTDVAHLAASPDGLDPTEGFLDTFTDPLRHATAAMVRPSSAERRFVVFCATCGVNPNPRKPATKSLVS